MARTLNTNILSNRSGAEHNDVVLFLGRCHRGRSFLDRVSRAAPSRVGELLRELPKVICDDGRVWKAVQLQRRVAGPGDQSAAVSCRLRAARNAERSLRTARDVYSELGPQAPIEVIARRAGVGERTLYRRFPTKADLIRAALEQCIGEDLTPTIEDARRSDDPLSGLAN